MVWKRVENNQINQTRKPKKWVKVSSQPQQQQQPKKWVRAGGGNQQPKQQIQQPKNQPVKYSRKFNYKNPILRGVDDSLRSFSQAADNIPKFSFADKIQNPAGKFAATIPQTFLNIPSNVIDPVFQGYGEDQSFDDIKRRAAGSAEVGLDIASFGTGSSLLKNLAKQGVKNPKLWQLVKEGFKSGTKQGVGYGAGFGATNAIQEDKPIIPETLKGAALGLLGGPIGAAIPVAGNLFGKVFGKGKVKPKVKPRELAAEEFNTIGQLKKQGETKATKTVTPTGVAEGQLDVFGNRQKANEVKFKFKGQEKTKIPIKVTKNEFQKVTDALDIENVNEIGNIGKGFKDVYRTFQKVFGKEFGAIKKTILDPFDKSKGNLVKDKDKWTKALDGLTKRFKMDRGSKKSAAVQQFGEGNKSYKELVKEFGEQGAKEIVEANGWFRKSYNQLLDEVNAARAKIYPGQSKKQIPKRNDYYRHFTEMKEGIGGLKNIFDAPSGISAEMAGVSSQLKKPKSKWLSFAQKRLGNKTDEDAVGGFIDYLQSGLYAKHIDPHIPVFRKLGESIKKKITGTSLDQERNNIQEFITDFANDLAGDTNPLDRAAQKYIPGGRKAFALLNWINRRVKANVILGNAKSSVAQFFNIPQGIANAGVANSTKGFGRTLASIFKRKNNPMNKSDFIAERYFKGFDKFDKGMLNNARKFTVWFVTAGDEIGTKYIWNSHYEKALKEGIKNPIKYADDFTREMVAGRGIGEVPLIQKSKLFQLVAPFQLEVTNVWHVMNKWAGEKAANKFVTFALASYVMNKGAEKVRGSGVSLDPLEAMIDAYKTWNDGEPNAKLRAGGRIAGEALSNLPFGQTLAGLYPKYGTENLPSREALFGDEDPTRFGSGLLTTKGLQDPLYKVLPPFGGQQFKRSKEGIESYAQGFSESRGGDVQYPIEQNPQNLLQSSIFGKYAVPEGREFFDEDRRPLGDKQTELFKQLSPEQRNEYYNMLLEKRGLDAEQSARHKQQAEMLQQGLANDDSALMSEAFALDPQYAQTHFQELLKSTSMSPEYKLLKEQLDFQMKKFDPFYSTSPR